MRRRGTAVLACIAALAVSAASGAAAVTPEVAEGRTAAAPRSERLIVQFAPGARPARRLAAREAADVELERTLGRRDFQLVEPRTGQSAGAALADLRDDPRVVAASRDGFYAPHAEPPNDPFFGELWGLRNLGGTSGVLGFPNPVEGADIDALGAWERTIGNPATVVAVIDSGHRFGHPDLDDRVWVNAGEIADNALDDDGNGLVDDRHGYDFVGPDSDAYPLAPDSDPSDDDLVSGGHGSHVAGTIGAAGGDGFGITGVAQDVRLMPLRVCAHSAAAEDSRCPHSAMIAAINYAGANGARVANISLGGSTPNPAIVNALAANPGVLYVVSAGNGGADGVGDDNDLAPSYPCAYDPSTAQGTFPDAIDNVVCVAATDQADQLTSYSNFGSGTVDLGAPGSAILSAYPLRRYYDEDFEYGQSAFDLAWEPSGADGGLFHASEAPLSSLGITDSPGDSPAAGTEWASTSAAVPLPAGLGECTVSGRHRVSPGGGSVTYSVLRDGAVHASYGVSAAGGASWLAGFTTPPLSGLGGADFQVRLRYAAGPSPGPADGLWVDDLELVCYTPVDSTAGTYAYLSGTSMAAPHVAGAAALLFSFAPASTVSEVREALLAGVDPVADLAGRVASGGRLDAARAIAALAGEPLEEPQPEPEPPPLPAPAPPASPAPIVIPQGSATPEVRCRVPRLVGRRLAASRRLLARANCRVGKVVKQPRRAKGRLVVKATRPRAGARRREGARVRIVLTTTERYRAAKRRALVKKRRALIRKRQAAKRR